MTGLDDRAYVAYLKWGMVIANLGYKNTLKIWSSIIARNTFVLVAWNIKGVCVCPGKAQLLLNLF